MATSQVVTYVVDDDVEVGFVIEPTEVFVPAGAKDATQQVRDAIDPAVRAAKVVLDRMRELTPDEVQVSFGVQVSGTANWLVAKAATEANFQVTLTWKPGLLERAG